MPQRNRRPDPRAATRRFANPLGDADHVDYKDTNLLRKFISEKGKIRSRRVTRVTARQQRLIAAAVKNAREMALLPYPSTTRRD
ncbi:MULTISPECIES: 30S ribosomal protein S18 [unclassified Nocardiopsis]|uniref:30S ribosomal protein S18 n=1 Tax=unclassified Nocardiopsis TaxID=2649073 RepID=UPI00066EBD44|nr:MULTISPECIES: 30S ribosomal protein S18 [unclassified Nocardiopsis]MBQ1080543.1 30S ribosomal protein S18 [Nocardiopsis sp. B62]